MRMSVAMVGCVLFCGLVGSGTAWALCANEGQCSECRTADGKKGERCCAGGHLTPCMPTGEGPSTPPVTGTVRPSGTDNVQVFVLSRDNQWWRKRAKVEGATWRVDDCVFGLGDAPSGTGYTLVAVLGADTRGAEALKEPPPGVAESARVRVFRK